MVLRELGPQDGSLWAESLPKYDPIELENKILAHLLGSSPGPFFQDGDDLVTFEITRGSFYEFTYRGLPYYTLKSLARAILRRRYTLDYIQMRLV